MDHKIRTKISRKKSIVSLMIKLYCKKHHNAPNPPCDSCDELIDYSHQKIEKCPNIEANTACSNCKIKCYNQSRQEEIKKVMRYSGPRMILYHPIAAIKHLFYSRLLD